MHNLHEIAPDKINRLHGVSARVKLPATVSMLVLVLLSGSIVFPVSVALLCLAGAIWNEVPLKQYIRRFSEPAFIASVIFILKAFSPGEDVLLTLPIFGWKLMITSQGLLEGTLIGTRVLASVSLLILLGLTTPFTKLLSALSWLKVPKTFVDILMLAYRYIFVLMDDAQVIYKSQKNRLGYAGLLRGLRSFGTLTGSVMLRALDQSITTTTAMVQRGYTGSFHYQQDNKIQIHEVAWAVLSVVIISIYFMLVEGVAV